MEVETALRRHLLDDPTVSGYVADKVYKFRLNCSLDRTGQRAIVVRRAGQWASPDPVKTSEYPLVRIELWADHQRDNDGNLIRANGEEAAFAVWRAVDRLIHADRAVWWGRRQAHRGTLIATCARWSEPVPFDPKTRPDGCLESAVVMCQYAVAPVI